MYTQRFLIRTARKLKMGELVMGGKKHLVIWQSHFDSIVTSLFDLTPVGLGFMRSKFAFYAEPYYTVVGV